MEVLTPTEHLIRQLIDNQKSTIENLWLKTKGMNHTTILHQSIFSARMIGLAFFGVTFQIFLKKNKLNSFITNIRPQGLKKWAFNK